MSTFERTMPPFLLVQTQFGDDLQAIAQREMGDANRWPELVWLNGLAWPYITDDPARVAAGVLLSGALIKVPAPAGLTTTDSSERGQVYERDLLMRNRALTDNGAGDFAIVAGADNLRQQLMHKVMTPQGQARRHPQYGCRIYRLIGTANGPTAGALGAEYVRSTLLSDYRVSSVDLSVASVSGDVVSIEARATAIEGGVVDLAVTTP